MTRQISGQPGWGIRIVAGALRTLAFLLVLLMAGIPMSVGGGPGGLTVRAAYAQMALLAVLGIGCFAIATRLVRIKR